MSAIRQRTVSRGVVVCAVIASAVLLLPILGLLWRVPWAGLLQQLSTEDSKKALVLSLETSVVSAILAVLLGVPLAWVLARGNQRVAKLLRPWVTSPLVLPPTVAGLALLVLMGRNGILGRSLYQLTGWSMPFTTIAVVVAGLFVGMPFVVLVVEAAFRQLPLEIEEAATTDGADASDIFWRIALPQSRNAVITGATLAWARALGEFGATLTFAGSLPGVTRTLPMQVYVALESDLPNAYALSAVLIAISLTVLYLLRSSLLSVWSSR